MELVVLCHLMNNPESSENKAPLNGAFFYKALDLQCLVISTHAEKHEQVQE